MVEEKKIITKWQNKLKRGFLWMTILRILDETSTSYSGMELINFISEKSHNNWKPSPGSIYPLLNSLEEDQIIALLEIEDDKKNKKYILTNRGKELVNRINKDIIAFKPKFDYIINNPNFFNEFKEKHQ